MRNLKSMVAFLVVAAMLFASFTTFAYNDVAADASYASAVETLSALEILKGDDQGNFNPDNTITRAESAAVIVRLLGLEDAAAGAAGATQFTDVAADHWGSGYINLAAQSGIIAGYGDGNFGPEDQVTYEQFVKMLVCALGYEPKALIKGTYPSGYLITANEMKLTAGVSGAAGQEAARKVVAQLAFNALDIPLMEQSGWGSDITYDIQDGKNSRDYKTLLTDKLDVYKVYGKVTATEVTGGAKAGEVKYKVEKVEDVAKANDDFDALTDVADAYINGTAAADMLGIITYAYLQPVEGEDKYNVLAIYPIAGKNDTLVIDTLDITSIVANDTSSPADSVADEIVFTYEDEDEDIQTITLTTGNYYLNGKDTNVDTDAITRGDVAEYTFIVNAADDTKADSLFVDRYVTAVVDKYDASRARIVLKNGGVTFPGAASATSYIRLDTEDSALKNLSYTLVDVNGAEFAVADLAENNILTIKGYADNATYRQPSKVLEMVVSTASVEGKISGRKTVDGIVNWTIGDTAYEAVTNIATVPALSMSLEGTFYLDATGKIALVDTSSVVSDYAFVYRAYQNTDEYVVRVLDKDGLNSYTIPEDKNVKVNGTSVSAASAFATIAGLIGGGTDARYTFDGSYAAWADNDSNPLTADTNTDADAIAAAVIELKANTDGVITSVDTAVAGAPVQAAKYAAGSLALGSTWLTNDTIIYNVPGDASASTELSIGTLDSLTSGDAYDYIVLGTANGKATSIVVVSGTANANVEAPIAIVTDIGSALDEEGNTVTEYTILTEGAESTIQEESTTSYDVGDVLLIVTDADGYIDTGLTKTVATVNASNIGTSNDLLTTSLAQFNGDNAKRQFVYGTVAQLENNSVVLNVQAANYATLSDAPSLFVLDATDEAYVMNFNKSNPYSVGDALDLVANEINVETWDDDNDPLTPEVDVDGDDVAHYALVVLDEDDALVSIIIIEPVDGVHADLR